MFERYSETARGTIFLARKEAIDAGASAIETDHLLIGVLHEPLEWLEAVCPDLRADKIRTEPQGGPCEQTNVPLSNQSKRAIAYAAEEAERLHHSWIGREHIVLGLLREEECVACRILREYGADLKVLRRRI